MLNLFQRFKRSVFRTVNKNLDRRDSSLNATLGIADETFEVLDILLSKSSIEKSYDLCLELGDLIWYATYLWSLYFTTDSIDFQTFKPRKLNLQELQHNLVIEAGNIVTLMKHSHFHKHLLDTEILKSSLINIFQLVSDLAAFAGSTLSEVIELNIEKLKKRYPDGFSPEASINRSI